VRRRDGLDADAVISTAHRLADAARPIALRYFRSGVIADNKARQGFDPVTEADRSCERAMREILGRERPDDAILGEEYGAQPGTSGLTWVLDPIDGTRAYLSGTPTWGVLIALRDAEGPLYGIIDQPFTGERFEGGLGHAETTGPAGRATLATRGTTQLSDAILFSTFPEIGSAAEHAAFANVAGRVRLTRYGLDCYAYALLALGQIDLVIEAGLQSYDILAPMAVIEAAGGLVTDWRGRSASDGGRILAAANPEIHAAALQFLRICPEP
jgi:histidinol phosphatase-like enzyme (inositol monophosphatase family)